VKSRVVQWISVLALTFVLGGHWALLQSVAWVTMAVGYSQAAPLKEALVKTFDGKHPCDLCKFVDEGRKSEKSHQATIIVEKIDLFLTDNPVLLDPPRPMHVLQARARSIASWIDSPLPPPPRSA